MGQHLIIERRDFLAKYLRRRLLESGIADNDIHVGLDLSQCDRYESLYLVADGDIGLVRNTFEELLSRRLLPRKMVLISSTDVYGRSQGSDYDEETPLTPDTVDERRAHDIERLAYTEAQKNGVALTTLRVPPVVGTGMQGILRLLVTAIWRGNIYHVEGNDARRSVVHAVDVADAAVRCLGREGVYNVTDGIDPTTDELIEALAYRMGDKRVYTVTPKRAKRLTFMAGILPGGMKRDLLEYTTTTLTFSSEKLRSEVGFEPHSVVEYLRTHDYDVDSL